MNLVRAGAGKNISNVTESDIDLKFRRSPKMKANFRLADSLEFVRTAAGNNTV